MQLSNHKHYLHMLLKLCVTGIHVQVSQRQGTTRGGLWTVAWSEVNILLILLLLAFECFYVFLGWMNYYSGNIIPAGRHQ